MTDSELRRLRAKAYGPGGGITRLELERLRALEAQARPMTGTDAAPEPAGHAEAAPAEPRGAGRADEGASVRPDAVGRPSTSAEPAGGGEPSPDPDERTEAMPVGAPGDASLGPPLEESPAEHPRRRGRGIRGVAGRRGTFVAALAAVVAMLLGIGIGIGWAAWDGDAGPALTAAQQEWQDALDDEDFDAGSIRPVAADERAVVWTATRYGGDRTCVVIGDGARTAQDCRDTRTVRREGLSRSRGRITTPWRPCSSSSMPRAARLRACAGTTSSHTTTASAPSWSATSPSNWVAAATPRAG